jgi:hypothetical protein
MEAILTHGSVWPLVELDKDTRKQDLQGALTFGNHTSASAKPEALQKLIGKDIKYGDSIPIPILCLALIPGLCILSRTQKSCNQNLLYLEMSTRSGSNLVLRVLINFYSYTCNNVY